MSLEEVRAIVDEVRRSERRGTKRPVAAHAINDVAIRLALDAGVDSIEHGYNITEKTLQMMAEKKTYLVLTEIGEENPGRALLVEVEKLWGMPARSEAQERARREGAHRRIRKAFELGVPVAFGSDAYRRLPGLARGEASLLNLLAYAEAGIPNVQVLQAATVRAAALLGWSDRIGALKAGSLADLIAVDGNPLIDIRALKKVRFVMKGGIVVSMSGPNR
jgi:imidazolonepropionase-like amidohydrolase